MYLQEGQTDWLGSEPVFYNMRTNRISNHVNELIEKEDIEFHPEGLRNYLEYGYCVFGQTPLKNIRFLGANKKVSVEKDKLKIIELNDSFFSKLGNVTEPDEVLECIREKIKLWERQSNKSIIVPTSSGFDSRLIASMIEKKSNTYAFTYGVSEKQSESIESVYAKFLCEKLGICWEQVELDHYIDYRDEWNDLYGISTHAHGMYQMEFYHKIAEKGFRGARVISGIYGDLWAGNWKFDVMDRPENLSQLGITHGLVIDPSFCKLPSSHELRDHFFEKNRDKLKSQEGRILFAAQMKVILLSYLLRVPKAYGFEAWSPFIDEDVVSKMLNLDWKRKEKRRWQIDYFKKCDLLIGEKNLKCDKRNCLDEMMVRKHTVLKLDERLLREIIDEEFIKLVNRKLLEKGKDLLYFYNIYTVLYPLERVLKVRENERDL